MLKTRLSSKGQVVIPKSVRETLHWEPGVVLGIDIDDNAVTFRRAVRERRLPTREEVDRVAGMLKYDGPPKTLGDIDKELTESLRREWRK